MYVYACCGIGFRRCLPVNLVQQREDLVPRWFRGFAFLAQPPNRRSLKVLEVKKNAP